MEENSTSTKGTVIKVPKETPVPFPMKAIRAKCLDCCCGQEAEVRYCTCTDCPLWLFRFGFNPKNDKRGPEMIFEK